MFFLIQAVIWTVAISITAGDTSHAVVTGYDEQALNWDEVKRRRGASAALGWKAELNVESTGDIRGNRIVSVTLLDDSDQPIDNATVRLDAFHRGRVAEKQSLTLTPSDEKRAAETQGDAAGNYVGSVLIQNSGIWQFNVTATRGDDEFFFETRLSLDSNRNY